nr:MAG TPA: hypothetical protein [Caudoviricetes sp.]
MPYDETKLVKLGHLKTLATKLNTDVTALKEQVEELVTTGGEPNKLEGVKVNGAALSIVEKMVDILIATGTADGTIAVNGKNVAVKGLATLQQTITTLVGNDSGKSARAIANEELAAQLIPDDAQESLNTLQEIADWIQDHPDDAAAMNPAITAIQAVIAGIGTDQTYTTVIGAIDQKITTALATIRAGSTNGHLDVNGTDVTVYTHPAHAAKGAGLYKVTVDAEGHVSAAEAVTKTDINGLGIPAQDTTYTAVTAGGASGLMTGADKTKLDGIAVGATKVEASDTPGNIKINGAETPVVTIATDGEVTEMLNEVFGTGTEG